MIHLTDRQKAEKLVTLINKNRSRDISLLLYIGRTLVNIFDGEDIALTLWKSACVEEIIPLCDEYWHIISSERVTPRMFMKIGEFLSLMPDIDINDIDTVKSILNQCMKCSESAYKMISRLNIDKHDNVASLINKKIDIRTLERYKYRYDIHTLEKWASRDNPSEYNILLDISNYVDNSIYDTYFGSSIWADIQKYILLGDKKYSNISSILKLLRSSIGCVKRGKGFFVMNDVDNISICTDNQFISMCSKIKVKTLNNIPLSDIVIEFIPYLMYRDITYYPGIKDIDTLNLFYKYEAIEVTDIDDDAIDTILYHIRHILANNDEEIYNYILNWLSFIIQRSEKPETVLLQIGIPGIGKTVFWEWFADRIIGMNNSFIAATLSDITGRFNGHVANKRFLLVNECKGTSKHDHEYLKTLITDSYVRLERKGQDLVQINSSHCIVITSNHRDHHFIDEHDRRFLAIECSKEKRDITYFSNLISVLDRSNDIFYTYLLKRDISNFNPSILPVTSIKQDMIDINIHPVKQFLSEYIWNDWLSASQVYSVYKEWCMKSSISPVPNNKFKTYAENMIDTKKVNGCSQYRLQNTNI